MSKKLIMNRRTFVQTMTVAGSASLAGCETILYGEENNESADIAQTELSEAAAELNDIELVVSSEVDITSVDFEGYSPENVTQHTNAANKVLADDSSEVGIVLATVSTILEETAYQYGSIDGVFRSVSDYRQRYLDGNFEDAIYAGDRFATQLSKVTDHAKTITKNLVALDDAGYETPVDGFSVQEWANKQGVLLKTAEAMTPLGIGFIRHADGMRTQQNAIIAKRDTDYNIALEEARNAKDSFETAEARFSESLELGLDPWKSLVKDLACLASGFLVGAETSVEALEAYNNGDENEGDGLWEQAKSEINRVNQSCLGEN
jgi:hypothetical protein